MSELKPCPFCGADNGYVDVIPNPFSNDIYLRGHCIKCHAVGTFYMQSYLEGELRPSFEQMAQMATEQWNTRPIEDELRKRIAELEAERRWIPVREKPLEPGTFLVLWKNGDIRKDWTYIDGGRYYWWNSGDQVTHYMPLPSFLELPNDIQKDTFVYGKESEE